MLIVTRVIGGKQKNDISMIDYLEVEKNDLIDYTN